MRNNSILIRIFSLIIFAAVAFVLYGPVLNGNFQFDDWSQIVHNDDIKEVFNFSAFWKADGFPTRFITFFSFALNYHFFGLSSKAFHIVNILIHICNTFLVFLLVSRVLTIFAEKEARYTKQAAFLSWSIALIFLIHPIQTQAVSYIYQRLASLATLFYLFSFFMYLRFRTEERIGKKRISLILCIISAVCAMFTKEISFTLPIMILGFDWLFLDGTKKQKYIPWIMGGILLIIPILFQGDVGRVFNTEVESHSHQYEIIGPYEYALTQLRVVITYMRLMMAPFSQTIDYDFAASRSLLEGKVILSGLIILLLISQIWIQRKKNPLISFGLWWFFLTLSVESSIIPIRHVIFEHRLYLPSLGMIAVIASLFTFIPPRLLRYSLFISFLLMLSVLTFQRNGIWSSEIKLWKDALQKSPQKMRTKITLCKAYSKYDEFKKAVSCYNDILRARPKHFESLNNRGLAHVALNNYDLARQDFKKAIQYHDKNGTAYVNLGNLSYLERNWEQALANYDQAIRQDDMFSHAYYQKALLLRQHFRRLDEALGQIEKAISLRPFEAEYYYEQGLLEKMLGQNEKAEFSFTQAIQLDPQHAAAFNSRGSIYAKKNIDNMAVEDFRRAIRIDPKMNKAYHNLGNVYFRQKDYHQAIKAYNNALMIDPDQPLTYYNRSQAHLKLEQYKSALKDAQTAQVLGLDKNISNYIIRIKSKL